jgi:hypothetical protein
MIHRIMNILLVLLLAYSCSQFATAVSEDWCLELGFDPSNLSCDTCALIDESTTLRRLQEEKNEAAAAAGGGGKPIDLSAECRTCCRSYKVNPVLRPGESLRGKWRCALLTYNENSLEQYGEIKDFIERDVDDVQSFKGENRFRIVKTQSSGGRDVDSMMMMYGIMGGGFGGGPPKLMLFGKQKKGGWSPEDEEEAGEVINLRGWKREDVKDMLITLLPNA